jgi:hypothetical protein
MCLYQSVGEIEIDHRLNLAEQVVLGNPVLERQMVIEELGLSLGLFAHHRRISSF